MNCTLYLRKLRLYVQRHEGLPSASALPLLFDCDEETAKLITETLLNSGHLSTWSGDLVPGEKFSEGAEIFPPYDSQGIPLNLQTIPAGLPAPLTDELYESLNIHAYLLPTSGRSVLLPISGDSMNGAGIMNGDLAVIDLSARPSAGDIVAAEIDGLFTLKRLIQDGAGYCLRAENPDYPDLRPKESLRIHGVLVGLARRY